jgi:hypothetical protein
VKISVMVGMIGETPGAPPVPVTEDYTGPIVEETTEDGELKITVREVSGRAVHWAKYAEGTWMKVFLVEGMEPEVVEELRALRRREDLVATGPLAGPPLTGPPPGNSGPN